MATRDRLKNELFKNGACPDESAYGEIFDSTINFEDDAIMPPDPKNKGKNPLTIDAIEGKSYALRLNHAFQIQHPSGDGRIYGGEDQNGEHRGLQIHAHSEEYRGSYIILRPADFPDERYKGSMFLTFGDHKAPAPENAKLYFRLADNGAANSTDPTTLMVLDGKGRVGIGTDMPGNLLTLASDNPVLELRGFSDELTSAGTILGEVKWSTSGDGYPKELASIKVIQDINNLYDRSASLHFSQIINNEVQEVFTIDKLGQLGIGIGEEQPSAKVHILPKDQLALRVDPYWGGNYLSSNVFVINEKGWVGIGTDTPQVPLQVEGFFGYPPPIPIGTITVAEFKRKEQVSAPSSIRIQGAQKVESDEVSILEFANFNLSSADEDKVQTLAKIVAGRSEEENSGFLRFLVNNGGQLNEGFTINHNGIIVGGSNTKPLTAQLVHRRMLLGKLGDEIIEYNDVGAELTEITKLHNCIPSVQNGASRRYRIYAIYEDKMNIANNTHIITCQYPNQNNVNFSLPKVGGIGHGSQGIDGMSDWSDYMPSGSDYSYIFTIKLNKKEAEERIGRIYYAELQVWDFFD